MKLTLQEAVKKWTDTFDAVHTEMMRVVAAANPEKWDELTVPVPGDSVVFHDCGLRRSGGITGYDKETEMYTISLNDGGIVSCSELAFDVTTYDDPFPSWPTMWSFRESLDDDWLDEHIRAMCECGFRVYYHEDFGYFFGIDGILFADFWLSLYLVRGLEWHGSEEIHADGANPVRARVLAQAEESLRKYPFSQHRDLIAFCISPEHWESEEGEADFDEVTAVVDKDWLFGFMETENPREYLLSEYTSEDSGPWFDEAALTGHLAMVDFD